MPRRRTARIIAGLALAVSLLGGVAAAQEFSEDIGPSVDVPSVPATPTPGRTRALDPEMVEESPPLNPPPFAEPLITVPSDFPFIPFMLGDFIGPLANPMTDLKVGEGESPMPMNRVFYRFNMYSNMEPERYQSLTTPYKRINLFTNVFGFEKTFGEWFSLGVRIPINTIQALSRGTYYPRLPEGGVSSTPSPAPPDYNSSIMGNINTIFKFKLIEDVNAGRMASGGVAVSFPTATNQLLEPGPSTAAIIQPFLGYIMVRDRFFLQGFTSITMPVVTVQSIILFSDFGVGMWAYRNDSPGAFLTGIAPTIEMHANISLQGPQRAAWVFERAGLPFNNQFNFTFGGTFEFWHRATLGLGFVVPVVQPLPFDWEFQAQFNLRF